jgi:hypothetical protein
MTIAIPDALPNRAQLEIDTVEAEQHRGVDNVKLLEIGHNVLREPTFDALLITLGGEAFTTTVVAEPDVTVSVGYDAEAADRAYDREDQIGRLNPGEIRQAVGL